jgi:glycosyltransferase involved in cell wall biosynthesis
VKIATLSNASVVHTHRWVEHFRSRGHEVRLWSLEPGPPTLRAEPLPALAIPGVLRYPLATPALRARLAEFVPDLVDAHFVPNYGLLGALCGRHPLSVTAWGSDLLVVASRDPFQAARARFVLGRADLVLADSDNLAAAARAMGASPGRLHAIPWGVSRHRFHDGNTREAGLMLSTRMHESVYDLETLIDGAARVMQRRPDLRLEIAGDGSRRASLERLAGHRLPGGRFRFVGRLTPDALADSLRRADLYLSASRSDSTSVSLLEAMACGALPVVSDLEGNREWVREGEGARLFAPGDGAQLAAALERALGDAAWANAARERNRSVIAERGDWDRQMARIESLFENAAGAGSTNPRSAQPAGKRTA